MEEVVEYKGTNAIALLAHLENIARHGAEMPQVEGDWRNLELVVRGMIQAADSFSDRFIVTEKGLSLLKEITSFLNIRGFRSNLKMPFSVGLITGAFKENGVEPALNNTLFEPKTEKGEK